MGAPGLATLLGSVRYEVLPARATEDKVLAHVPRDVVVTVTASPVKGLEPTLDLAARLSTHGYRVLPHWPARLLRGEAHLKEVVDRLREAGVDDVFLPAGDADPPAGPYTGALPVLRTLGELGAGFSESFGGVDPSMSGGRGGAGTRRFSHVPPCRSRRICEPREARCSPSPEVGPPAYKVAQPTPRCAR